MTNSSLTVIGLMSGTSFDGVDAALIKTNGQNVTFLGPTSSCKYPNEFRYKVNTLIFKQFNIELLSRVHNEIAHIHANLIKTLLNENNIEPNQIDLIGFPGQTLYHNADSKHTFQIGNAALLTYLTKINVISDFRSMDLAYGGQGAPLVPLFHLALFADLNKPICILNIGGVANVTYLGNNDEILAFDCGPGCALINDLMLNYNSQSYDKNGEFAKTGKSDNNLIREFLEHDYFKKPPPKSLDRNTFQTFYEKTVNTLSQKDAAATLLYFTAAAINIAINYFENKPALWIACGGGRKNKHLLKILNTEFQLPIVFS